MSRIDSGGRELAMALRRTSALSVRGAAKLLVSLALAYAVNAAFRAQLRGLVGG